MPKANYLMLLLEGFLQDRTGKYLANYYYREIKNLTKELYEYDEINSGLNQVIENIQYELDRDFKEQLSLWRKYNAQPKQNEAQPDLSKPLKEHFPGSIPLYNITNGKHCAYLNDDELQLIKRELNVAQLRLQHEKITESIGNLKKIVDKRLSSENLPSQEVKYPAKFYALYHWLKIVMGTETTFNKNDNDQYVKSEIVSFAKNKYPGCSPQGFYRSFKDLDITNHNAIANSFGKAYKQKLIAISNNDNKLITYLKNYPN